MPQMERKHARPNILFVTSDEQHPSCLGLEDERLRTPNLDRIGREGALFTRSYTCSPICTPARATWVTGQYPSKHGAWGVGTSLDKGCVSVARLLGRAGYRTAMIGKSHLQPCVAKGSDSEESFPHIADTDYHRRWHGPWYGFEHAEINVGHADEPHSASMHYRVWLEDHGVDVDRYFTGREWDTPRAWDLPEEFHPCRWAAERSVAYLRDHAARHPDRPFYLNLNFPEPHWPFHVPEPWASMYADTPMRAPTRRWGEWEDKCTFYRAVIERRHQALGWAGRWGVLNIDPAARALDAGPESADRFVPYEVDRLRVYYGMVSILDDNLGRVLACLDELGLAGNTLVVYTSDHGDLLGDHYLINKGACHYDGCIRVPTLVRWPGRIEPGRRSDALLSCVDLAPTFMAAAGLEPDRRMQGVDQTPVWTGRAESAREGVWVDFRAERGLYVNTWVTDRHRLSVYHTPDTDEVELFDQREDPNEFVNLAAGGANADVVADLSAQMLREVTSVACPWQERIAFA